MLAAYLSKNALGVYQFRRRVPLDLVELLDKKSIVRSCKTRDYQSAIQVCRHYASSTDKLFDEIRERCNMPKKKDININLDVKMPLPELTFDSVGYDKHGQPHFTNVKFDPDKPAAEEAAALALLVNELHTTKSVPQPTSASPLFSTVAQDFLDEIEKSRSGSKKPLPASTKNSYKSAHRLFIDIMGDKNIDLYTFDHAKEYRDRLMNWPRNRKKVKKYRDKSVKLLLGMNIPEIDRIDSKTIKDHLIRAKAVFEYATNLDHCNKNIFKSILYSSTSKPYTNFTDVELKRLFSQEHIRRIHSKTKASHYWAPLISLYTGARRSEIFFLTKNDVKEENGISFLNITDEDSLKEVKTPNAVRVVPVHSKLIELGFLDYIESVKSGKKLFEEYQKASGNPSQAGHGYTEVFANHRKNAGVNSNDNGRKVFHSFRKTLVNRLQEKKTYTPLMQKIIGHSTNTLVHDTYGGEFTLETLSEAIESISFNDVLTDLPKWSDLPK